MAAISLEFVNSSLKEMLSTGKDLISVLRELEALRETLRDKLDDQQKAELEKIISRVSNSASSIVHTVESANTSFKKLG